MPLKPLEFWDQPKSPLGRFLIPLSWIYQVGAAIDKFFSKPLRASVPVISIGNIVMGGAGKTPVTIAIAETLKEMGRNPHIITRGYGGSVSGPLKVDLSQHHYSQVGDEPLMLAKYAPTWVSRNRKAAVDLAIASGADVLLLDDAHQNYSLEKDIRIVVVNGLQGFGNGRVFPAGPLRQTLSTGLRDATAVVYIDENDDTMPLPLVNISCPLIHATITPVEPSPCAVFAFAGIGYPEKFKQTLMSFGYEVKGFTSFPDHYAYKEDDIQNLRLRAMEEKVPLITTEKDGLRIPTASRNDLLVLNIVLDFHPQDALRNLLKTHLEKLGKHP